MQNKKALFLLIGILIFGYQITSLHAQNANTVSGVVTDASSGESLPGVNIVIGGTAIGTSTDLDGNYSIEVNSLQDTLLFSFIGYQTQQVPIDGRNEIDVAMAPQVFEGSEVMVVGYGTQSKRKVVGSVDQVQGSDINAVPSSNISNNLAGRLPGLVSQVASGEPGNDASVLRIRGSGTLNNSEPLIVIDGVPARRGGLNRIDPNSIESIDIVKGASGAIYGARAANGVILVTTKRGQTGTAQFDFNFERGFQQPTRTAKMADAPTFRRMQNEIEIFQGRQPIFSEEEINCDPAADPFTCFNTDWFDVALQQWAPQYNASLSVAGGNESTTYRVSASGLTQQGQFNNSGNQFSQVNLRSNIDTDVTENFSLRLDINTRLEDRVFPSVSTQQQFRMLVRGRPNEPAFWPNGLPAPAIENGVNPVVTATPASGQDKTQSWFFQSTLGMELDNIAKIEGLSLSGNLSFDKSFANRKNFETPFTLFSFGGFDDQGEPTFTGSTLPFDDPRLTQENTTTEDILVNIQGEYQTDIQDHSIGVLWGGEWQQQRGNFFGAFRRFFLTEQIPQLDVGGDAERNNFGNADKSERISSFSRITYDYKEKYLLEFVGRVEGSFIFAEGNRFGFFPAISAGYRISEEDWFQDFTGDFFDELKILGSWGRAGNDRIDAFQFIQTFGFGDDQVLNISDLVPTVQPGAVPNPNITWEVDTKRDIGFEGSVFDNQLSFDFAYFNNQRKDILSFRNASIPRSSGFQLPRENIGRVSSWGYDASLDYQKVISDDLTLGASWNITYNNNRVDFFDEPPGAPPWQLQEGKRLGAGLFFDAIGILQSEEEIANVATPSGAVPGDVRFRDVDGNGIIDDDDKIRLDKSGEPKWTGGFTFRGNYRNFDFNIFLQGQAGGIVNTFSESGTIGNFFANFANNRSRPGDINENYPRVFNRSDEFFAAEPNTFWLRDTRFIRLKNINVGYTLPGDFSQKYGIGDVRVYFSGSNLFTFFDDMSDLGLDPETATGQNTGGQGAGAFEGNTSAGQVYPAVTVLSVGIDVSF